MSLTIPLLGRPWKWRTDSLLWREVAAGDSCFRAFQHLLSVHPSPITRCAGLSTRPGVGAQLPHSQWVCAWPTALSPPGPRTAPASGQTPQNIYGVKWSSPHFWPQVCAKPSQSCPILRPHGGLAGSSVHGDSPGKNCWSGCPCPPPGDLPHSGTEPASLTFSALPGGFFTTSATGEAPGGGCLSPSDNVSEDVSWLEA